ncbi:IclR family transcriptional regulator [Ottowia thiooxydans]|uniref:IclR family transcriptional regulator n=1 Tax=Ottowia thiooxydans TaxID=219182 RepID=UPI00068542B1|nr:IclR family transcriptional regulator [Ottowia thiooxydans]
MTDPSVPSLVAETTKVESESTPRLDGTVVKGMALIEFLAAQDQPQAVSVIAQHFNWQRSNAHRLLTTFKALGYVRQNAETSRYELSLKTWELGMRVVGRSAIKRAAQPHMRSLNQQFQESVNLSLLVGTDVLYLDTLLSMYPLRPTASPGARVPSIFTATGRAQLAFRSDAEAITREIIASRPEATNIKLKSFQEELKQVRNQGYAITLSGWRTNVNSVAVPILNADRQSIAAIGISGPSERLNTEKMQEMVPVLMYAAAQIAEVCGGA